MPVLGLILEWLYEQRNAAIGCVAIFVFVATLILHYGFGVWWPRMFMLSVGLAGLAIVTTGVK